MRQLRAERKAEQAAKASIWSSSYRDWQLQTKLSGWLPCTHSGRPRRWQNRLKGKRLPHVRQRHCKEQLPRKWQVLPKWQLTKQQSNTQLRTSQPSRLAKLKVAPDQVIAKKAAAEAEAAVMVTAESATSMQAAEQATSESAASKASSSLHKGCRLSCCRLSS